MTFRPDAFKALAFASTASVADSAICPTADEIRLVTDTLLSDRDVSQTSDGHSGRR